jgi:trk system potassium uptake protein TrkH
LVKNLRSGGLLDLKEYPIRSERRFQPAQLLALSFVGAISGGALLLLLPFSTKAGHISFVDALFTSTSAVCVTGLIVQDTATYFTTIGQVIIMVLFQLGGLGIMAFSTLVLLVAGKKVSIQDRLIIQQGYHYTSAQNVKSLIKNIFIYTLIIEGTGTLLLFLYWHKKFPGIKGFLHSIFHAISAFCNAGFSLFSDSFMSFRGDTFVNITIILLIVLGGLGFLVLKEGREILFFRLKKRRIKMSLHSKMIFVITFLLIALPFLFFLFFEWDKSLMGYSLKEKVLSSLFQIITPRTAGFNTMDLSTLSFSAVSLLIFLMFIGASPGSTGGGIKTSTFGVIFAFMKSRIAARESVSIFRRTLPGQVMMRAFTVVTLSIGVIFLSSFVLFMIQPGMTMKQVFFEVFSAFGTVGLSLGITPELSDAGKIVITLTMYIGRIGPLTMLYAFSKEKSFGKFEYVEESVMIG